MKRTCIVAVLAVAGTIALLSSCATHRDPIAAAGQADKKAGIAVPGIVKVN